MPTTVTPVDETSPAFRAATSPAAAAFFPTADAEAEFDRQLQAYIELGFPDLTGRTTQEFRAALAPLSAQVRGIDVAAPGQAGSDTGDYVPFVVVLGPDLYDVNDAVPAMRRGTARGVSVIGRDEAAAYGPIDGVEVPTGFAYVLRDIDTGSEFCGVRPEEALTTVTGRDRTPLTIGEGVALVIVRPDILRPNKCFSLMASRAGNQRVPAIWISERRPKLGWCWNRNPHPWLGAASAAERGPVAGS